VIVCPLRRNVVRPENDARLLQQRARAGDITDQLRVSEYRQRGRNIAADADRIVVISVSVPGVRKERDQEGSTIRQRCENLHLSLLSRRHF
jgi:hypothetical protein